MSTDSSIAAVTGGGAPATCRSVRLRLLRDPAVVRADGRVCALEPRAAGLLALVALEEQVTREHAAQWLWPASADPRKALRQQLLRFQGIARQPLLTGAAVLRLAAGVLVDALDAPDGALLGDLELADCVEFNRWLRQQRRQRQATLAADVGAQLACAAAQGDAATAAKLLLLLQGAGADEVEHYRVLERLHEQRGDAAQLSVVRSQLALCQRRAATSAATARPLAAQPVARPTALPERQQLPASLVRPPRLIGRAAEIEQVQAGLCAGAVVAVLGEAGIGKSRLLHEFARASADALMVAARPGDGAVPLALVIRLAREIVNRCRPVVLEQLPVVSRHCVVALLPDLASSLPPLGRAAPLSVDPALLSPAFKALLALAPVALIIVDDLHYADAASMDLLLDLLVTADSASPRWLLAQRPAEGAPARALRSRLADELRLVEVRLPPLGQDEIATLVDSLALPSLVGAAVAPLLRQRTGGSPLFVLEMLKHGRLGDAARADLPPGVLGLIIHRLRRLGTGARALTQVAAIAGQDFDLDLAQAVLGVSALDLADDWGELEAALVFAGDRFAHDLVAEAAAAEVTAVDRAALHATVAAHLSARATPPPAARLADHWERAGQPERALPCWRAAAAWAQQRGQLPAWADALDAAARCADEAGDAVTGFDVRIELYSRAFLLPPERSQALAVWLARAATTALQRARVALAFSYASMDPAAALASAIDGLRELKAPEVDHGDAQTQACECELRGQVLQLASKLDRADVIAGHEAEQRALLERLPDGAAALRAAGLLAIALNNSDRAEEAAPLHARCLRGFAQSGDLDALFTQMTNAVTNSRERGLFALASAQIDDALQLKAQLDDEERYGPLLKLAAGHHWRDLGRYDAALQALEDLCRRPGGYAHYLGLAHLALALTWHMVGQPARAQQQLAQAELASAISLASFPARLTWLRAQIAQSLGQPHAALLEQAHACAPTGLRRRVGWQIALEWSQAQGDAAGYARAQVIHAQARAVRSRSVEMLAECALAACAPAPEIAAGHGERALALLTQVDASTAYKPQLWLTAARALVPVDPAAARAALREADAWIAAAADHVPVALRETFLQRHYVNRPLRELLHRLSR